MPHLQVSFELQSRDALQAEAACFACGALSVTYSDEHPECSAAAPEGTAHGVFEPLPGEVRLWPRTRLTALFAAERAEAWLIATLAQALGLEPTWLQVRAVPDRIWEREWLRDFHALSFGRRLWVCPRHETVTAADAVVVRLDPGLAFGTGTHPSTALCLQWLDACSLEGRDLIDYGCGSGVLAIAALKLGARRAYAFDIDPQARLATRENAEDNGVAARLELCEHEWQLPRGCELLVANILSEILLSQAALIAQLMAPRAQVLLSGILEPQAAQVAAHYATWFDIECYARREGWVALHARRLAHPH